MKNPFARPVLVALLACPLFLPACGGGEDPPLRSPCGAEIPIEPSPAYRARQAEYLAVCSESNGPGRGGTHGQVCRVATGQEAYDEEAIDESLGKINRREDTADFGLNSIVRMLCLDRLDPVLPAALRGRMEEAVLGFKYWLQEPGPDEMCWWSENHQILFHAAELLAGQLFPARVFPNSGMTGREHVAHALPLIRRWLEFRGRFGFSEFHSNVYFNEDVPPLVNLADFAEEQDIRARAAMVLDVLALDMAANYYRGNFAAPRGRTYQRSLGQGQDDSTREAAWLMLGLGGYESAGNFSAAFLATSRGYAPPPLLEALAADAAPALEHRQRDSIDIEEGPAYGIGTDSDEDVMFWWGATGYVAPEVITGSFRMIDEHDMWGGFIWRDLQFLRLFVGSPVLRSFAEAFEPMSRGVVLEGVDTYTYRTPSYQLSGAQDFKPAMWAAQVHVWQATLDRDAYVFTTYPGGLEGDYMGGDWTGGFLPRATFHRNVGVIQYRRPAIPLLDAVLFKDYTHAFFPREAFDEVVQEGRWTLGRKGDAYVALFSEHPAAWSEENGYELVAEARENVWIVELGDAAGNGSFARFVEAIRTAPVDVGETVTYLSPSVGSVAVGWEGPMTVEGRAVDLGPYRRWDNPYCRQTFGTDVTDIALGRERLELDFGAPSRRCWRLP